MNKKPIIAICYDVDKTLSPKDSLQEYSFFQKLGLSGKEFYSIVDKKAEDCLMERSSAYMYCMLDEAKKRGIHVHKETIIEDGKNAEFYNGVETWFKRINEYGKKHGVIIEHYILSANIKEILEATKISKEFKKIYASSFLYNEKDEPIWPAQTVNYTYKTQFLYRIKKGVLEEADSSINNRQPNKRIPFDKMIYIGDSFTDIPCMAICVKNGGYAIGVYDDENKINKVKALIKDKRIQYYAFADFTENSQIDQIVKHIVDKVKASSDLANITYNQLKKKKS